MRELRKEFMELDGRRVKIVKNLKVNVLEKSQDLLAKYMYNYEECSKPTNNSENNLSDDKKLNMKPVRVDIGALDKKATEEGVLYGSYLLIPEHTRHCEGTTTQNETQESVQPTKAKGPGYEDDIEIIDSEEFESEVIINIDDSSDSEAVSDFLEMKKLTDGGFGKNSNGSFDLEVEEYTALLDTDVELKKLLKESEEKLKNRKKKITSLKMSLANMEMKNAEKKLSIQKRDKKIKELEEMIKTQENILRTKNLSIFKLQKENNLLRMFKASLKPVNIEEVSDHCDSKNRTAMEEMKDVSRNICEKAEVEENVPYNHCGENESLSEFLSMVAEVKNVTEDERNCRQAMIDASKNNESNDIVEIGNDDINEVNKKAPIKTVTTISDDDIQLVNDEEDDILIPTLEHYPLEGVPSIEVDIVDPFLRLQPFSTLCAKSLNIVGRESRKRKNLPSTTFSESRGFRTVGCSNVCENYLKKSSK